MAPAAGEIQYFIDTEPAAKPLARKIKYHHTTALAPIGSTTSAAAVEEEEDDAPPQVLRSEIPLQTPSSSPAAETSTTIDYFSLDVDDDNKDDADAVTPAASPVSTPTKEVEKRTLEGSWFRTDCRFKSPMLQLHKEILDFCEFLSPTAEEREARHNAIEAVFDVIKFIWPRCKAEVFGSFRTGLYLPTSDIDIVIMESHCQPQLGLNAIRKALAQRKMAKDVQVIAKARVPIIKFVEKKSGFSFDISFDVDNGPKAADFIKDAVINWPPLRPLCLILKIFLQQRMLNEVYTGGIGSYALLTMLIAMLQNYQSGQSSPEHNLGVLLVQFFDLYGRKLNTEDVGVSCDRGGTFFLKTMKGFTAKSKSIVISIQDPQTPDNDIGKSSFNYFQVRSAFSRAFMTLTNTKTITSLGPNRSILGTIILPDAKMLERKGGSNGDMTFHKLLPGSGDPLPLQNGGHSDMYCNWQLGDEDDEPLPRSDAISGDGEAGSSGKKRKTPGEKRSSKKAKKARKDEDIGSAGPERNGSKKVKKDKRDKSGKKLRWRLRPHSSS